MTKHNNAIEQIRYKLDSIGASENTKKLVNNYYQKWESGNTKYINLNEKKPVSKSNITCFDTLNKKYSENNTQNLSKLAIIKLNGGLGTGMGCLGPKSLIPIKDNACFLEIILNQLSYIKEKHGIQIPLLLMNSFNTNSETEEWLSKHNISNVTHFTQNQFPRIDKETKHPFQHKDPKKEWNPPGHGDVYMSLYQHKLLEKLRNQGIDYLFISNADNLGATVSTKILDYMIDESCPYLMEITTKTDADKKGGVLTETKEGALQLVEIAQVEEQQHSLFFDQTQFPTFNTNNIWVHIPSLIEHIEKKTLKLDLIINKKVITNTPIIQFETAMGSAIQSFKNAKTLIVPRSRFFPVKTTSDLLFIQSDGISISDGFLNVNSQQHAKARPIIKLGDHFQNLADYHTRFQKIPSLINCTHLELSGDIYCTSPVTLSGSVTINVAKNKRYDLSEKKDYTNCKLKIG